MADVAVLPADAREPDATPSLLVLEAQGMSSDRAHLALLERGDAWEQVAELELDLDRDALEARWLVGLADRRFALVATSPAATEDPGYSVVIGLDIRDGATPAIVETGRSRIDRAVEDAAAADVDGLGTPELVLGIATGSRRERLRDDIAPDARRSEPCRPSNHRPARSPRSRRRGPFRRRRRRRSPGV